MEDARDYLNGASLVDYINTPRPLTDYRAPRLDYLGDKTMAEFINTPRPISHLGNLMLVEPNTSEVA